MPTVSFAVTVCNEHEELVRLIDQLVSISSPEDEIVIQADSDKVSKEVHNIATKYQERAPNLIRYIQFPLNKDFATYKNNIKRECKKDYIFFIDADEYLSDELATYLKAILDLNEGVDCYCVPRINVVEGLTQQHLLKWRWSLDEDNHINYPDYQTRICKNKSEIVWSGKVHEILQGWLIRSYIPFETKEFVLIHHKTIEKQERQNKLYETI